MRKFLTILIFFSLTYIGHADPVSLKRRILGNSSMFDVNSKTLSGHPFWDALKYSTDSMSSADLHFNFVYVAAMTSLRDYGGSVPRTLSAHWADTYNVRDFGASMMGNAGDRAVISSVVRNLNNDAVITLPCGGVWPSDGSGGRWSGPPHVSGRYLVYDATCAAGWPTGGQIDSPLTDGDLTVASVNGGRWFLRKDIAEDNGAPVINIGREAGAKTGCFWGWVSCNEPTVQVQTTIDSTSDVSPEILALQVDNYARNPYSQQPQGLMVHANNHTDSSMWGFAVELNDLSHLPPQSFSQINELDSSGNGADIASAEYDPSSAYRKILYFAPSTQTVGAGFSLNTAYAAGALVVTGDTTGTTSIYRAQNAGTSDVSAAPAWPADIGDTVVSGTVTWKKINSYEYEVGDAVWFNHNPGSSASYINAIAGNAIVNDAALNTTEMTFPKWGGAAIRLGAGQVIDFSGNATQSGKNVHTLQYSNYAGTNSLVYIQNGKPMMYLRDSGNAEFDSSLSVIGNCVSDLKSSEMCYNAHGGGDADAIFPNGGSFQVMGRNTDGTVGGTPALAVYSFGISAFVPTSLDGGKVKTDGSGNLDTAGEIHVGTSLYLGTMSKAAILALPTPKEGQKLYDTDDHVEVTYRCPAGVACGWFPTQYGKALGN